MNWVERSYIAGAIVVTVYVFVSTLTNFSLGEWLQNIDLP
jgi:hypothetical protein